MSTSRSDGLLKYLKAQCPLPLSIVIIDSVADVNHIPLIRLLMVVVKILAWDQLLVVQIWTM